MNALTGKPFGVDEAIDDDHLVMVSPLERAEWERSWIGKHTLLSLMPLREVPARDVGSQR